MARRAAIGPRWSALAGSLALHGGLAVVGFVTRGPRDRPTSHRRLEPGQRA